MGNQNTGLRESQIMQISLFNPTLFIGEPLTGKIILKVTSPLQFRDISLYLTIGEGWYHETEDSNNNKIVYEECNYGTLFQIPINVRQVLNQNSEIISLPTNIYEIPFIMYTNTIPFPSVEYPRYSTRGYVRYILTSELIGYTQPEVCDAFLHLKTLPLSLNTPLTSFSEVTVYKWGLMGKGKTSLSCSIPKNTYYIGENIPIACIVDNTKGDMKVTSIKISIHRIVHFIPSKQPKKYDYDESIASKEFKCNVEKGTKQNISCSIEMRDNNLSKHSVMGRPEPLTSKDDINLFVPTCLSNLVKIEYNVKATAYFESMTGADSRPRCQFPISIGHFNNMIPQQNNPMQQQYQQPMPQPNPMQQQYQQPMPQPNPMQQQYQQPMPQPNPMEQQYQQPMPQPNPMEQQYQNQNYDQQTNQYPNL
jgi:hypothetical protein